MPMKFIDMHCDTPGIFYMKRETGDAPDFYDNDKMHISLKKLIDGDCLVQFFAHFDMFPQTNYDFDNMVNYIKNTRALFAKYPDQMKIITKLPEADETKVNALLTVEDGGSVNGSFENMQTLYDLGIRAIALTWNFENCFGFPNSQDAEIMNKGLKPFGIEAVEWMNEKGVAIDVSHLSDGGFYDVVKYTKKPFIASHSNSRSMTYHTRNLTDDMIKLLADKGGVTGINFAPQFLSENEKANFISDMVRHIDHITNVGGIDVMALGSDFDGIRGELEIAGAHEMGKLAVALNKAGYSDDAVEKIFRGNATRCINEITGC
ncbi:MAG: membrane dipeptidase [Anaerofustis stercorihominis]|nr:membrane dipeptidase [Anaerofustis stercorihominis]